MDTAERLRLIKEVGEEVITEDHLQEVLDTIKKPVAYDGFEPSGKIHIAQGILRAINVNKMVKAGCHFKMFVADWHGWANNKMGGDLERIKVVGKYMIEVWKAAGLKENVEFVWASELINDTEYWKTVLNVARASTVNRIVRCSQIMGRAESEALSAAQIFYPCMQAADIFHLKVDIAQLGMDQRKVNVLAREIGPKIGYYKPVAVHHHMLMGLGQPPKGVGVEHKIEMKMSKSKPDTAIFMTDEEAEVTRKITKAYCPPKQAEENPLMDYVKYLIFEKFDDFTIERPEKFGGDVTFTNYDELSLAYTKGELHAADLKHGVASYTNKMLEPFRTHFEQNSKAKKLKEQVESFKVTR